MSVLRGLQLHIVGGLTVQANGTGVLADGAGPLTLASVPANPSTITGNGTDVSHHRASAFVTIARIWTCVSVTS
jgi:hypothetical protein